MSPATTSKWDASIFGLNYPTISSCSSSINTRNLVVGLNGSWPCWSCTFWSGIRIYEHTEDKPSVPSCHDKLHNNLGKLPLISSKPATLLGANEVSNRLIYLGPFHCLSQLHLYNCSTSLFSSGQIHLEKFLLQNSLFSVVQIRISGAYPKRRPLIWTLLTCRIVELMDTSLHVVLG